MKCIGRSALERLASRAGGGARVRSALMHFVTGHWLGVGEYNRPEVRSGALPGPDAGPAGQPCNTGHDGAAQREGRW